MDAQFEKARAWLRDAEAVVITAGAGMGVDSGLPDFRGNQGFWNAYPAYEKLGFNFIEMASPERFSDAPELGWGFYGHRLHLYQTTTPHDGFTQLLEYAQTRPQGYGVFTSNVDGHFQTAGFAKDRVVECHGSIHHLQCFDSCTGAIWEIGETSVQVCPESMRAQAPLPSCPECGGLARPNILMFGDWGWLGQRTLAQDARLERWMKGLLGRRVVILEFGAGIDIPTVRRFSEQTAKSLNASLIRVNPREPVVPPPHVGIALGARDAIREILS